MMNGAVGVLAPEPFINAVFYTLDQGSVDHTI